jgi:hypothetical protein
VSTVNKVAHENVGCVGNFSARLEKLKKVVKLPMNVAADSDRRLHRLNVRLF